MPKKPLWQRKIDAEIRSRRTHSKALCEPGLGEPYTTEETEFLRAIDDFRRLTGKPPTLLQGLHIALTLGWRKVQICPRGHVVRGENAHAHAAEVARGRAAGFQCRECRREKNRESMRRLRAAGWKEKTRRQQKGR